MHFYNRKLFFCIIFFIRDTFIYKQSLNAKAMKTIIAIVFSAVIASVACSASTANNTISLKTACDNKLVKLYIHGRSSHYGECMEMDITNLTNYPLNIKLETGKKLNCKNDTTYQNMMVTRELMIALNGKENKTYESFAMCTQKSHSSPDNDTYYKIGNMAEGYLLQLAQIIEKHNYQDNAAQKAVWIVIEKGDSNNLFLGTSDPEENIALKRFIALAKADKPIWDELLFCKQGKVLFYTKAEYCISGEIRWNMPKTGYASLAVFDEAGNYITDVFIKKEYEEGNRHCNFKVTSCLIKPDKKYIVKLKIEERTIEELACVGK